MSYNGAEKLKPKGMSPMKFPFKCRSDKAIDIALIIIGLIGLAIMASVFVTVMFQTQGIG